MSQLVAKPDCIGRATAIFITDLNKADTLRKTSINGLKNVSFAKHAVGTGRTKEGFTILYTFQSLFHSAAKVGGRTLFPTLEVLWLACVVALGAKGTTERDSLSATVEKDLIGRRKVES